MNRLAAELAVSAEAAAQRLLGAWLVQTDDGLVGRIVETEAYDQTDAASHSHRGKTARTQVMFGPPGHLYVYFTYGMHYCCNVVCGPPGQGAAVLIRAIEPLDGQAVMASRRAGQVDHLTDGPAKVCQAFGINRTMNGHDLTKPPLQLVLQPPLSSLEIEQTVRVGITRAAEVPWRFYIKDNQFVSNFTASHRSHKVT